MSDPTPALSPARLQEIRERLDRVKQALRDNEINVLNPAHHAQWSDVEYLLDLLADAAVRVPQELQTIAEIAMLAVSDPHADPAVYRDALRRICNLAIGAHEIETLREGGVLPFQRVDLRIQTQADRSKLMR